MKIAVIHDYADAFRKTQRLSDKLKGHEVVVHTDAYTDPDRVVEQVAGCDALVLTQQRVPLTRPVIEKLPQLKFISQTGGNVYHLDVAACTEHGIVISAPSRGGGGTKNPYSTTGELAWGLILASLRHIPFEVERLKQGALAIDVRHAPLRPDAGHLRVRPHRRGGGARRARVRHERGVLGPRRLDRPREGRRLRGRGEPRGVLRERRRDQPASASAARKRAAS